MNRRSGEDLLFEVQDGIATLTLNRPDRRNALTTAMYEDIRDILKDAKKRDEIKVLIVTGNGPAFCAGADIADRLMPHTDPSHPTTKSRNTLVEPVMLYIPRAFRDLGKPIIGAINGVAAGGGLGLALLCDMRIASEKASFVASWINIGLHPDLGASFYLTRIVGADRALRIITSGQPVDAKEAERINMVSQVVPHDDLMKAARELAAKIAKKPSVAIELAREAVHQAQVNDLDTQLYYEVYAQNVCFSSQDFREEVKAFQEKRPASFKGL